MGVFEGSWRVRWVALGLFSLTAAACVERADPAAVEDAGASDRGPLDAEARLGQALFEDENLSLSRTQSCASCHASELGFAGNNRPDDPLFPVAIGHRSQLVGGRNTPTAMYATLSPAFAFVQEEGELLPTGGQFWDGRASTLAEQAAGPFLNPKEMGMPSERAVIERVRNASYAPLFRSVYGDDALDDVASAYELLTEAIAAFESSERFAPFSSKFDAVLRGDASFDKQEERGFSLFKDPEKGNCIACHVGDEQSDDPRDWPFTDFTYDNLGIPRNSEIPDNRDPDHFDLGLCAQPDLGARLPEAVDDRAAFVASLCGAFKVPTLRNVGKTAPYMHNGRFARLRDVVDFYVTRGTHPERWYPRAADGSVRVFDDLPAKYHGNVNGSEAPYDRELGEEPRLSAAEIDDVVAFLRTLSDGYAR